MADKKFEAILTLLVPQVINLICENYPLDEMTASKEFYESKVYSLLEQEDTKLWHFSPLTLFNMFDEEEQLEQAVENADALPDNEKPDAPAISNKMHELNGAQVSELMKIILEMRKKHPGWIAVEVQSADGSEVLIKF